MASLVFRLMMRDAGFAAGMNRAQQAIRKVNNSYANMTKDGNRASGTLRTLTSFMKVGKIAAFAAAGVKLGEALFGVSESAMEAIESQNLFNVALATTAVKTGDAVEGISGLYGLDSTNIKNAVGTFALLARSMGMSADQASTLGISTYKLGLDLSSLTNVPINQVMQDLRSGLVGQSETVYKYGMDVTEAGIKQEALRQGIDKSVRSMSQGEKMALRYAVMIRTGAIANSDFARTFYTPANQMKILSERFVTLGRSIGSMFIPLLTAVLPYLNAFIQILTSVFNQIAAFFGYKPPANENMADTLAGASGEADDLSDNLGKAGKKAKDLKKTILGIDEINVMAKQPDASGGGAGAGGASILPGFKMPTYETMFGDLIEKGNYAKQELERIFGEIGAFLGNAFKNVDFTKLIESFWNLVDSARPIAENVGKGILWFIENVVAPLATWVINEALPVFLNILAGALDVINSAIEAVKPLFQWLWDSVLVPVANWTGGAIIDVMNWLAEALTKVSDWINNNQGAFQTIVTIIGSFAAAFALVNVAMQIFTVVTGIATAIAGGFAAVMAFITSPIGIAVIAIGALIAIGVLLARNWDKVKEIAINVWNAIVDIWNKASSWFVNDFIKPIGAFFALLWEGISTAAKVAWDNIIGAFVGAANWFDRSVVQPIRNFFKNLWDGVKNLASGAWNGVKNIWESVSSWFNNNIIQPVVGYFSWFWDGLVDKGVRAWEGIKSVFSAVGNFFRTTFENAWNGVVSIFSVAGDIFVDIKDGIVGAFKWIVNGIIDGINKVVSIPFNGINSMLNRIRDVSVLGVSPFAGLWGHDPIRVPQIPRLATGGIVTDPTFAQIGEAGAEAVIPLSRAKLEQYLAPVLGNINTGEDQYDSVYAGVKDAFEDAYSGENVYNIYVDGQYQQTIRESKRRGIRSGKVSAFVRG